MVRTRTDYEWALESVNTDGDIEDHHFADKLKGLVQNVYQMDKGLRLVLVRTTWDLDIESILNRGWAYPEDNDGKLPAEFDNGEKVPQRFHAEWASLGGR